MLRRLRKYENWNVSSSDAHELGTIVDFYFDDERWTVRYLVIRTGNWLTGRFVLQSPIAIARVQSEPARFELRVTQDQIRSAPTADLARPVSHQSSLTQPVSTLPPSADEQHLRSAREVAGYHIRARDGDIGHLDDFLVDDDTWRIRYLLVDTSNWVGGRSVILATEWVDRIDWPRRQVHLDVSRQIVKESAEYKPGGIIADLDHRPVRLI